MLIHSLDEIASDKIAVIVNCGTKALATLALLSTIRHLDFRPVVIDCESKDGSFEFFTELMKHYDFDLISRPLMRHGLTLDWIFRNTRAKWVALVDSDAEILDGEYINHITAFTDRNKVFGMGFVHGPCWIKENADEGYYQERMWVPFSILNVGMVNMALDAGKGFSDFIVFNDVSGSRFLSRLVHHVKRKLSFMRPVMNQFRFIRGTVNGLKPAYVYCDTGASVFQYLKYVKEFFYVGLPAEMHKAYVAHHHGVTRKIIDPNDSNATLEVNVIDQVIERVRCYLDPQLVNLLLNPARKTESARTGA